MAVHGPFKNKVNAENYASRMRGKGFSASTYKTSRGWAVSVTR